MYNSCLQLYFGKIELACYTIILVMNESCYIDLFFTNCMPLYIKWLSSYQFYILPFHRQSFICSTLPNVEWTMTLFVIWTIVVHILESYFWVPASSAKSTMRMGFRFQLLLILTVWLDLLACLPIGGTNFLSIISLIVLQTLLVPAWKEKAFLNIVRAWVAKVSWPRSTKYIERVKSFHLIDIQLQGTVTKGLSQNFSIGKLQNTNLSSL